MRDSLGRSLVTDDLASGISSEHSFQAPDMVIVVVCDPDIVQLPFPFPQPVVHDSGVSWIDTDCRVGGLVPEEVDVVILERRNLSHLEPVRDVVCRDHGMP